MPALDPASLRSLIESLASVKRVSILSYKVGVIRHLANKTSCSIDLAKCKVAVVFVMKDVQQALVERRKSPRLQTLFRCKYAV